MKSLLSFDSLVILGWYDGVTVGIGETNGTYHVIVLIAWKMTSDETYKISAIFPINKVDADALRGSVVDDPKGDSVAFNQRLESFFSVCPKGAYLTRSSIEEGKIIEVSWLSEFNAADLLPYDDDRIFFDEQNFARWDHYMKKNS